MEMKQCIRLNIDEKRHHIMAWKVVYRITYPNGKIYIGQDVTAMEMRLIREHRSNDPDVGYNLRPKFIPISD